MRSAATESSSPRPAPQIGGRYRLAGLQPTRQQVLDHIDWYGRQLAQLGVDLRLDTLVDGAWIADAGAEIVIVATGASPARAGFQRAAPMSDRLPGIDARNVALDRRRARRRRGTPPVVCSCSTTSATGGGSAPRCSSRSTAATVCIATSAPTVAAGLFHSAADVPARQRFAHAPVVDMRPHTVVDAWHGDVAMLRSTLTDAVTSEPFDWLVIAETPRSNDELGLDARSRRRRLPPDRRLRRPPAGQPRLLRRPITGDALVVPPASLCLCHRHRRRPRRYPVTQTGGSRRGTAARPSTRGGARSSPTRRARARGRRGIRSRGSRCSSAR